MIFAAEDFTFAVGVCALFRHQQVSRYLLMSQLFFQLREVLVGFQVTGRSLLKRHSELQYFESSLISKTLPLLLSLKHLPHLHPIIHLKLHPTQHLPHHIRSRADDPISWIEARFFPLGTCCGRITAYFD